MTCNVEKKGDKDHIYVEQAFKSCEAVLSFSRKVGKERLISACRRGIMINVYTYTFIGNTLKNHLDELEQEPEQSSQLSLPFHKNIRGSQKFFHNLGLSRFQVPKYTRLWFVKFALRQFLNFA